jgi:TonB-linked SusC/RagA family outer membrane protein
MVNQPKRLNIMSLISILKKYRFAGFLLAGIFLFGNITAQEKTEAKRSLVNFTVKVADEAGNPVPGAAVVVGEGFIHAQTDQQGTISFNAAAEDFVTISKSGFERTVILAGDLVANNTVVLVQAKILLTSEDVVPLPFMTVKKRHLAGSSAVIKGSKMEKYPTSDIRNAFTGIANGLEVRELDGSPGVSSEEELGRFGIGEKINISARGRNVRYIIDEIPTDITEMMLDPGEIESVTVIKDVVEKSMYGPYAADGVIFIKTKRGRENERILTANAEYGVSMTDRMPEWVSGADYARLNNIARQNSGLLPLYDDADIAAYAKNDPYDMYHPSVNYGDMMLKDNMSFTRVNLSSTGGSDRVQYYAYLGYTGEGDIYNMGAQADYNRINARSNIDIKINDVLKAQFDFFGALTYRRSPNYGYDPEFTSEGTDNPVLSITEMPSVLGHITTVPPVAYPVYANNDPSLEKPWYAVSPTYPQNPIGNLVGNGYYQESGRNGTFNVALDFDMKNFVEGLKSRTYVGFSAFNLLRVGKAEDYTAYTVTPSTTAGGQDTILLKKVHDGVDQADQAKLHDHYYQRWAFYESLNYNRSFGRNTIQGALTYYMSKVSQNGTEEPQRQLITSLVGMYSYNDRYNIHGVLNYAGSSSFSKDARYFLSPTIGVSWIVSEENFLNESKLIDLLKVRAEYGVIGYESFRAPYGYRDDWNNNSSGAAFGPYSANQWFGSATDNLVYRTVPSRTGNPDLTWETRKEFNAGIDLMMADRRLEVELNYYNLLRSGMIQSANQIPYVVGISSWRPVVNYNEARYTGVEAAVTWNKNQGDFKYSVTGRATLPKSVWAKYDEPAYRYDYQKREGQDIGAIYGQTYLGRFATDQEALEIPQLFDEVLHAGDLKYADLNGDGAVDDNDQSAIGSSSPKLLYAFDTRFQYKNFELAVIATGRAFYDVQVTNRYYHNGWGDNTYSKFVLDNVMNNGDEYPKLTYYQVNNNFETSNYWLRDGGFFKIQNVELAYNVPVAKMNWNNIRGFKVFFRGANLYTFSKLDDVDPESVSSGVYNYPLFRTVTGGVKLTF